MIKALYHIIKEFFVNIYKYYKYDRHGIINLNEKNSDLNFNKKLLLENADHKLFLDKIDMKIMEDFLKNYDPLFSPYNKEYWFPTQTGGGTKIAHMSGMQTLKVLKNRYSSKTLRQIKTTIKIK